MKIAIQGHPTRGKEVIQILESLGGINKHDFNGFGTFKYYINSFNRIDITSHLTSDWKIYTLEEFEKDFPFKIGDKVVCKATQQILHTIVGISLDSFACMQYEIKEDKTGIITHCPTNLLIKYKEMNEERNITLTLDKAKEWYKKGGELKEVALQAYSEEELTKTKLPKTWKEFCNNHMIDDSEAYFDNCCQIYIADKSYRHSLCDKNICPSKKSAEAHIAMIQLEQLRDCWRQGWIPATYASIYAIKFSVHGLCVYNFNSREFLSFPTKEMAEEFLKCFKDLIEKAGDLI